MARRDQFFTLTAFGAIPTHKYTAIPELVWWALRSKGQFSSKLQKIWHYNELDFTFTMSQTDYVIWICKARNLSLSLAYSEKAKIWDVLFFLFYGLQMITDSFPSIHRKSFLNEILSALHCVFEYVVDCCKQKLFCKPCKRVNNIN